MLDKQIIKNFKSAAKKLSKNKKREFMAEICLDYFGGSSRQTEKIIGWKRTAVELGLNELRTGIVCLGLYQNRGVKRIEDRNLELKKDILRIVDRDSQTDPSFKTTLLYSRISASTVIKKVKELGKYSDGELPSLSTMGNILNRLGYNQKKLKK